MSVLYEFSLTIRDPRPVSVNKLYGNTGMGGRRLTAAGRKFKDALTRETATLLTIQDPPWNAAIDAVYNQGAYVMLDITLHTKVLNGTWKKGGSLTKKKNRRSPYQLLDASNYVKIIEDALVDGTGIDDSAHLSVRVTKLEDRKDPRIEISYQVCD